jgi:UDP-N-acetylmuramoyl-tripeptide--D-alanyl-D-alanine ligase
MSVLWTSAQAVAATGGRATADWSANGVSIDSRTLQRGDLFVALTDVRDGHDFVAQALANGAAGAVVSRLPPDVKPDAPLLMVDDVMAALNDLARAARARSTAQVVAVTGSVGKTSTKDMLRLVLAGQGRVHAAEKSLNNQWGVPLTLARMPQDADFAVVEIGMNHPGEIAPLAVLTRPHVALITTVAAAHLQAFADLDAIAHEKASVFAGLMPGGSAVISADVPVTPLLVDAARNAGATPILFGRAETADFRLLDVTTTDAATIVRADIGGDPLLFKIDTPGAHFAANALGALAVVRALGGDLALASVDMARWQPPAGRGTRETIVLDVVDDHLTLELFDDAYNANPTSLAAALDVLAASTPRDDTGRVSQGRRIAILGDMLELGANEMQDHADFARHPAMRSVDVVHCVGPRMRALYEALDQVQRGVWCETADQLAGRAHALLDAGDVILVKGSKGSKVSLIVDAIRKLGHPLAQKSQGTD